MINAVLQEKSACKNVHFLESAKKVLVFLGPCSVLIICYFIGYESLTSS